MTLNSGLEWIWRAWHRLTHDRPMHSAGMGGCYPGRIAWATIDGWCRRHDYTDDERDFMDACFAAMDAEYIDWAVSAQKAAAK